MDLIQYAQLGGTVVTVMAFIFYMSKKDHEFNSIIRNHLDHSTQAIRENSKAMADVAVTLKELCVRIQKLNGRQKGVRKHEKRL